MPRRSSFIAIAAVTAAVLSTGAALAESHTTFFMGAGATGTSSSGFRGGYGFSGGVEIPVARNADLLLRGDYHAVPAEEGQPISYPVDGIQALGNQLSPLGLLGNWPDGAARVNRIEVFSGLRLHPPHGAVRSYLDLLIGVGSVQDRSEIADPQVANALHDDTNVALSLGGGLAFPSPLPGSMFIDAHYDFYFVGRDVTPIIPIKLGMRFR